jgi:hypothetical protein
MNFYIDPYILAIEEESITKEQLEDFIDNLIDWKKLIDMHWGRVYKPTESFDLLFKHNLYPLVDKVKELTEKYHIDYIQPEEIDKIVNSILNKIPTIEDTACIHDILIESDSANIQGARNQDFIYLLKKLTIILKLDCVLNKKEPSGQVLLSKELEGNTFKYEATLSLIDSKFDIAVPCGVSIEFSYFENFKSFCSHIEPTIVWLNAQSDLCIKMSIFIKILQTDANMDYVFQDTEPNFILHNAFFDSMRKLGFHHEEKKMDMLLRALHEEILQINMKDTHEIRVSKGGSSKQLTHNGYDAWRRDIDYEYHLHYWKKGEKLVFTDVVPHNIVKITKI